MHHPMKILLLVFATVGASVLAPNLEADSRVPVHPALSDILRCSPTSEREQDRFERVGWALNDAWIYPADIYDPADCARANPDFAEMTPASASRRNA